MHSFKSFKKVAESYVNMQDNSVKLHEKVSSASKANYENMTGKKPSGRGIWMFSTVKPSDHSFKKDRDQTFTSPPLTTYADAVKLAVKHFKEKGHKGEIHLLS